MKTFEKKAKINKASVYGLFVTNEKLFSLNRRLSSYLNIPSGFTALPSFSGLIHPCYIFQ